MQGQKKGLMDYLDTGLVWLIQAVFLALVGLVFWGVTFYPVVVFLILLAVMSVVGFLAFFGFIGSFFGLIDTVIAAGRRKD